MAASIARRARALVLLLAVAAAALPAGRAAAQGLAPWTDVTRTGAAGDGRSDDTAAVRRAVERTPAGGLVLFPPGRYRLTGEILVERPVSFAGVGRASQVYQASPGQSLLVFRGVQAVSVRDLYLGSLATAPGASLVKLVNTHHARLDNIIMRGGHYGVHLMGSLLNTFTGLRSGTNFGAASFFAPTSTNRAWVMGERFNDISSNANMFVAPALEGGTDGIVLSDTNGEGSLAVYGGTIEGVAGVGVSLRRTGLPSVISGVHMEANGTADIRLERTMHARIEGVFATRLVELAGALNTTVENALVERVAIDAASVRTRLDSVTFNLSGGGAIEDASADTQYQAVSDVNPTDWFGTVGLGRRNPNSNPEGLTPGLKLDVDGTVRAEAFSTGDIAFRKDGRVLWRMFEDEAGLQLEDARTGEVSRVLLERDAAGLRARLEAQDRRLEALRAELDALRRERRAGVP
jgi:hypothetical protein